MEPSFKGNCLGCGAPTYAQSHCDDCSEGDEDEYEMSLIKEDFNIKKGSRVGAFLSVANGVVQFLGWGVYQGKAVPDIENSYLSELYNKIKRESPLIKLDSGKKVYGHECYWGSEQEVKNYIEHLTIIPVNIEEHRINRNK